MTNGKGIHHSSEAGDGRPTINRRDMAKRHAVERRKTIKNRKHISFFRGVFFDALQTRVTLAPAIERSPLSLETAKLLLFRFV